MTSVIPGSLWLKVVQPTSGSRRPRGVDEPRRVTAARPVLEVELDLLEGEPGAQRVDRHAHLAPEPGREREACRPRLDAHEPLARERLARRDAGAEPGEP